jgi:hypothetical protein
MHERNALSSGRAATPAIFDRGPYAAPGALRMIGA